MTAWDQWFSQVCRDRSLEQIGAYHDRIDGAILTWWIILS